MTRIEPLEPPYAADIGSTLERMMPPGIPPIRLFRTFANNLPMTEAITGWGGYELSRELSLTMRHRELVIDRTCARCGCEYEWGVHLAFFAERVGLTDEQITSITHGAPTDPCWDDATDRLILQAVDELHDHSTISDDLWSRLSALFSEAQLLDLTMLCGWYHAISFTANSAQVTREDGTPTFDQVIGT